MEHELNEPILVDNYPVYGDYCYVCDGKVYRSEWHDITVGQLKQRKGFKEVRRCDIVGRQRRRRCGHDWAPGGLIDTCTKCGEERA